MQLVFLQWLGFYDSIYKLPATDKPTDDIIADNEKLDRWFEQWQKEIARSSAQQQPVQQHQPVPQLNDLVEQGIFK